MKDTEEIVESSFSFEQDARWQALEQNLNELLEEQRPNRLHLVQDMFKAVIKLAKESPGTLNLKITSTALKELRYSFKMFYPHRFTPKITIFGSARVAPDAPLYAFTKDFAKTAVKKKFMIITGGGPGIMAAGNEGAEHEGFGLNIRLPLEQAPNPFLDPQRNLIHYKYFFTRKLFLVKEASAFAFFPGGFGTLDEAFEVLTLLQTGKTDLIPVVLLEPKGYGYWESFLKFLKAGMETRHFVSEADFSLFHLFNDPKAAIDHIQQFYRNYHSMRVVRQDLVIRLRGVLSPKQVDAIREKFGSLSKDGTFRVGGALPDEQNETEVIELPRLIFPFDRRDFGVLRQLIDFINTMKI